MECVPPCPCLLFSSLVRDGRFRRRGGSAGAGVLPGQGGGRRAGPGHLGRLLQWTGLHGRDLPSLAQGARSLRVPDQETREGDRPGLGPARGRTGDNGDPGAAGGPRPSRPGGGVCCPETLDPVRQDPLPPGHHLQAVLTLCCEVADLGPFLQELGTKLGQQAGGGGPQPVTLSQEEAERLVLSHHVVQNLLPAGTIINDWEPLRPLESNLEILRRRGLTWVADRAELPSALSLCTTPHRVPYRADALHFSINIFSGEQTPARAVLLAQLQGLLPSLRGYVIFHVCLRPCLWAGMRDFCRSSSGVSFFREHWEQLLLERDV
ncbi:histidine N-acetyltransferase-like isoform X2 [Lepisosteus oculatus]|uniref:histidine N-acetyltransferase-like isoform X2 n=1 Tax=Lepisosteus oculatus TaxID=7918 RepID=UPI003710AE16